jgi:ribonuclease-3
MPDPALSQLQKDIGHKFRDPNLLVEAITHKSFQHEYPEKAESHNERLEFMGDSVLGLVVADYLFKRFNDLTEAEMSRIKSHLVKRKVLADIASGISLGNYLRVGKGEEGSGGRMKLSILANAMEAVIGAVFEDAGYDRSRDVVLKLLREKMDEAIASGDYTDYKSQLQELCQTRFGCLPEYRLAAQEGEEHKKTFKFEVLIKGRVMGAGTGRSKKEAQIRAAGEALQNIESSE